MKELLRTNDAVLISWLLAALDEHAIEAVVLDTHTAILEGSIGAIQRRVMVADADYFLASRVLADAGRTEAKGGGHDAADV